MSHYYVNLMRFFRLDSISFHGRSHRNAAAVSYVDFLFILIGARVDSEIEFRGGSWLLLFQCSTMRLISSTRFSVIVHPLFLAHLIPLEFASLFFFFGCIKSLDKQ